MDYEYDIFVNENILDNVQISNFQMFLLDKEKNYK